MFACPPFFFVSGIRYSDYAVGVVVVSQIGFEYTKQLPRVRFNRALV